MELVREFLAGVLEVVGGVVEEVPGGLHVLLPSEQAERLSLPEEARIDLDPARERGENAIDGRFGSPLLEQLVAQRLAAPAVAAVALPPELPRSLPDHLPVLLNAVRRGATQSTRRTLRYLAGQLRVVCQADEVRSAIVPVCIRLADGACTTPLPVERGYTVSAEPLNEAERQRVAVGLERWLCRQGVWHMAGALEALKRRARRDLERMAEYYAGLYADMNQAARRARSDAERARRLAKLEALASDLDARRRQLRERLRPRVFAEIIAATLVETETERSAVPVRRRSSDAVVTVDCRASDSVFEGPGCDACGVAALRVYLCDDALHVLCDQCGHAGRLDRARCPACTPPAVTPLVLSTDDPTRGVLPRIAG